MATVKLDEMIPAGTRPPRPVRREVDRLGRVVAAVSAAPAKTTVATDQPCNSGDCSGAVWGTHEDQAVEWWCPHCGRSGQIVGWQGTRWNRGGDWAKAVR
jgi:hypothetical protein